MPDSQKVLKNSHTFLYRGLSHFSLPWNSRREERGTEDEYRITFSQQRAVELLKPHSPNGAKRLTVRNYQSIHIPLFFAEKAILQLNKIQAEKREESNWRIVHHYSLSCHQNVSLCKRQQPRIQSPTELMQIFWLFALSSDWLLLQLSLSTVERQFICACSVNLAWLMPETAGMRLCRFVSEEMKEHRTENNNWLSIWNNLSWDNLSCHLFLCNLDGGVKVLKLLCGVWKEVIF